MFRNTFNIKQYYDFRFYRKVIHKFGLVCALYVLNLKINFFIVCESNFVLRKIFFFYNFPHILKAADTRVLEKFTYFL